MNVGQSHAIILVMLSYMMQTQYDCNDVMCTSCQCEANHDSQKNILIFPLVSCCCCVNNTSSFLKATKPLVSSSRSNYMTSLLNEILYVTEMTKIGSSQYTNNI